MTRAFFWPVDDLVADQTFTSHKNIARKHLLAGSNF
jgi:hypothetical protein